MQVENTRLLDEKQNQNEMVKILKPSTPGLFIRPIGCDIAKGEKILEKGEKLGPSEIGLLASCGCSTVSVFESPIIGVLSTGNELVDPKENELPKGCIRDSNRSMLLSAIKNNGMTGVDLGIAQDTLEDLEKKIMDAFKKHHVNVLITTGGVSMGELDLMPDLMEKWGKIHFGRIHMKPGKPLTFSTCTIETKKRLLFGLPGNPVSGMVTFNLLCLPALRKLSGWADPQLTKISVRVISKMI